jgi:hypothetical protein
MAKKGIHVKMWPKRDVSVDKKKTRALHRDSWKDV